MASASAPAPDRPTSPGDTRRGPVVVAAVALLVATPVYTLGVFLPAFNTPHTALEGVARRPAPFPPTPGVARRLAVLFVDGISFEKARSFEALAPLRRAGVFRELAVAYPSYTQPALASIATGLSPRDSGLRLNSEAGNVGGSGVPGLDSFPEAAADAGVPIRFFSREWDHFVPGLHSPRGAVERTGRISFLASMLERRASPPLVEPMDGKEPTRELTFVYFGDADEAAHYHGLDSPEFRAGEDAIGGLIARYAATLDLEQDTLVLLSDHGHLPRGGHGGVEPEVTSAFFLAVGGFVRRGVELGARPMVDVASTLSVLAGVRTPAHSLGRPMVDILALEDEAVPFVLSGPFDQEAHLLCTLAPHPRCGEIDPLVARMRKLDADAGDQAEALLDTLTVARERTLFLATRTAPARRLAVAGAVIGAGLVAALVAFRRRIRGFGLGPVELLPALVHAGVYGGGLAALGYGLSFSTLKPGPAFMREAFPTALGAAVAVAVLAYFLRPRAAGAWLLLLSAAIPWVLLAAFLGADPTLVPPPVESVTFFELAPAMLSAALGALAVVFLGGRRRASPAAAR